VFSHEILNANPYAYLDDAPLEERRARAVQLRSTLRTHAAQGAGILDQEAIEQISAEVWPEPRNADELHDALLTLIRCPAQPAWQGWFDELQATGRAEAVDGFWTATECKQPEILSVVRGWMECLGPVTASQLAARLAWPVADVHIALATLEAEGQVFSGRYRVPSGDELEWCNRRILARIHRLTLGRLRREIEPVTAAQFQQFLDRWQHIAPETRLHGADGVLQIIRQLQGCEMPASAWEPDVLSRRIQEYNPEDLDELCLSGEIMWARLSTPDHRVRPTRIAPISIFLREDMDWLISADTPEAFSPLGQEIVQALTTHGASFFADLVRLTKRSPDEIKDALWELTAGGLVTADGFENLRTLIDAKHRRRRHAAGRWARLARSASALTADERTERHAQQLLLRWGVLFRDVLVRETVAPPWRDLLLILRRMEAKGEIRGGRFVAGFTGEQYARPEAIDLLRAVRRSQVESTVAVA
jgi:ATP-dependent Lhr-like helicase